MAVAIKRKGSDYFPYLCPPAPQRKRTADCEKDALDMLEVYRDFKKITVEEFQTVKSEIKNAKSDDAISGIMCRIRHRVKW